MPTARTLVTDALDLLMVHAAEEPLTAHQEQQGLRVLNDLIQSASLEQFIIYYMPPLHHPWPLGVMTQTWGMGGDIAAPRPLQIGQEAYRGAAGVVTPIAVLTPVAFRQETVGVQPTYGVPQCVGYHPALPLGYLQVWPIPQEAVMITVYPWQVLTSWPDFDTDLLLPPGYDRFLKSGLAMELAPYYDKEANATVQAMKAESKNNIKTTNLVIPVLEVPWFADPFNKQSANIYSG